MYLGEDYDPHKPDLALVCQGGKVVQARAFLLMLASDPKGPLMPAIKMALNEHASGQQSSHQLAPAGAAAEQEAATRPARQDTSAAGSGEPSAAATGSSGSAADDTSGLAVLKVDQDSAEDWQLLLSCLDYPHALVAKPHVTWVGLSQPSGCHHYVCTAVG